MSPRSARSGRMCGYFILHLHEGYLFQRGDVYGSAAILPCIGTFAGVCQFLSFCMEHILIRASKTKERTDHFVANGLRYKLKYLLWEDEFCWRSNNSNSLTARTRDVPHSRVTCYDWARKHLDA